MEEAKRQLQKVHFDSNAFISLEMKSLGDATEMQLFELFEKLMEDVEEFSESLEEDVLILQEAVDTADDILLNELRQHAERLTVVKDSVDEVERNFERASEGAVRIGSRLAATEREKCRIESAILTLDLVTAFEAVPTTVYSDLDGVDGIQLLASLPKVLSTKGWGEISQILFDLRKILVDINADEVQAAQTNVLRVSEALEGLLLNRFEHSVMVLTQNTRDKELLRTCKDLAVWLHLFSEGRTVQKRYIFSVVEKRLPTAIKKGGIDVQDANGQNKTAWKRFLQLGDEAKKNKRKYGTASRATRRHVENDEEEGEGEDEREDESNDDSSGGAATSSDGFDDEDEDEDDEDEDEEEIEKEKEGKANNVYADKNRKSLIKRMNGSAGSSDSTGGGGKGGGGSRGGGSRGGGSRDKGDKGKNEMNLSSTTLSTTSATAIAPPNSLIASSSPSSVASPNRPTAGSALAGGNVHGLSTSNSESIGPGSTSLISQLSELFNAISAVCAEQFMLIRKIFPPNVVARVTRQLILRIFCDPAFGIQARVDAVLVPRPPREPLTLPDYLDALTTVRAVLSSLYVLLLEHCSHPDLRGMGLEYGTNSEGAANGAGSNAGGRSKSLSNAEFRDREKERDRDRDREKDRENYPELTPEVLAEEQEIEKSENEVKEFLSDQISQVLGGYVTDYFDKEVTHLKLLYLEGLRRAVGDEPSLISKVAIINSPLPKLKAERMKTIQNIVKSVANKKYIDSVFALSTDAVLRMASIGKDDTKRLPLKVKDLFLLHLSFIVDSLLLPWSLACTTMLLKFAAAKPQASTLPPMVFLSALSTLYSAVSALKTHFEDIFLKPLSSSQNTVVLCRESRRQSLRGLEIAARESTTAWTLCTGIHIGKLLSNIQSKYDYSPKDGSAPFSGSPTTACDNVCRCLLEVANTIRIHQTDLIAGGMDLVSTFWRPFGRQLLGVFISHFRKQRVTPEGGQALIRDLNEYCHTMAVFESPETVDMMICLREILSVTVTPAENVVKTVTEQLRHLDPLIILAIVRSRADFQKAPWTKALIQIYGSLKFDAPLPWENKKQLTVMSFADAQSERTQTIGPLTLRNSTVQLSPLFMQEVAKANLARASINVANTDSPPSSSSSFNTASNTASFSTSASFSASKSPSKTSGNVNTYGNKKNDTSPSWAVGESDPRSSLSSPHTQMAVRSTSSTTPSAHQISSSRASSNQNHTQSSSSSFSSIQSNVSDGVNKNTTNNSATTGVSTSVRTGSSITSQNPQKTAVTSGISSSGNTVDPAIVMRSTSTPKATANTTTATLNPQQPQTNAPSLPPGVVMRTTASTSNSGIGSRSTAEEPVKGNMISKLSFFFSGK